MRHSLAVAHELEIVSAIDLIMLSLPNASIAIGGTILGAGALPDVEAPVELPGIVLILPAGVTAHHMQLGDLRRPAVNTSPLR